VQQRQDRTVRINSQGWTGDSKERAARKVQLEEDNHIRTARKNIQDRTCRAGGRIGQAEQGLQNRTCRTGHAELDR
jgi:hypothetical protein